MLTVHQGQVSQVLRYGACPSQQPVQRAARAPGYAACVSWVYIKANVDLKQLVTSAAGGDASGRQIDCTMVPKMGMHMGIHAGTAVGATTRASNTFRDGVLTVAVLNCNTASAGKPRQ